jgi:hypothetical protein
VDDQEAEYLRSRNRELEAAVARWRAVALVACMAFLVMILAGAVGGMILGQAWVRQAALEEQIRDEVEVAREEELQAREQAERALAAEREARRQAEPPPAGPVEHVAGGLGLAARTP